MGETVDVQDKLIDGLSYNMSSGASYVSERRSVTYFPTGGNIYSPNAGQKIIKFQINDSSSFLDPSTLMLFFEIQNTDAGNNGLRILRPLHVASWFRRLRILCNGQLVDDIDYYNRAYYQFEMLTTEGYKKDNQIMT